jgi:hypothetical protein
MSDTPTTILDEPITDISAVQGSVSVTVKAKKGSLVYSVEGDETAAVKSNASAAEVLTALENLGAVDSGDFVVTGGPGDELGTKPYFITATADGQYAGANFPSITVDDAGLEEGEEKAKVAVVTEGSDENPDAVQRGTGFADRTEDTSPLVTGESPAERRAGHGSEFGDA